MINHQQILAKRPTGMPHIDTWSLTKTEVPELRDGQILIRNEYVSLDPAMRGWMNESKSYIAPVEIGEVMRAGTVGEVVDSRNPKFRVGDHVTGWGGVQEYTVTDGKGFYTVDTSLIPSYKYLSVLGMPGMTAYFGILDAGKIDRGDTVLVSGAAGAVGSIVGQIAKIKGCRVVGIAGGPEKCSYLRKELGFDAAIDYKDENLYSAIKEHCPEGIDVYFDNVGGETLDAALANLRLHARVIICGAISQYNSKETRGPKNYLSLLVNRATMQGILVMDYADRYGEAALEMGQWMREGELNSREDIYEGIDNFYSSFERLFSGQKEGKLLLKL